MEATTSRSEIEPHVEIHRKTTSQGTRGDVTTAFTINFDGDHPTTGNSGHLGPFMPPKKLLQRERLRQATKQGNTLKRMTKNIDDKINNNNDTSHDNKTSCDDGKKSVTDPNCGHVEPFGAESDTGTYTVENDEDGDDLRKEGEGVTSPSECRKEVVGLKNQEVEKGSSEWVSEWASKTTSMEQPYSDELSLTSCSSERDVDLRYGSRRKLPATPRKTSMATTLASPKDGFSQSESPDEIATENYLLDTFTLMTAMEARINVIEDRSTTPLPENKDTGKIAPAHTKPHNIGSSLRPKDNAGSSKIIAPALHEKTRLEMSQSTSIHRGKDQVGHIKTRPTKTNRAFMLRQQLNTKNEGRGFSETVNKVTSSVTTLESGISRFAVGRHSARKPKDVSTKLTKCNEGRCNSTLSPKEAEYQAWKRRQNYKPFHVSTPKSRNQSSATIGTPATLTLEQKAPLGLVVTSGGSVKDRNLSWESSASLQRSASFHYPDGMRKVQKNVYLSEDDSTDEVEHNVSGVPSLPVSCQISELLEVSKDELIRPVSGSNSKKLSKESTRLEALDNLVISTLLSISIKLCSTSTSLLHHVRTKSSNPEEHRVAETLVKE